jgi:hypothetical protein
VDDGFFVDCGTRQLVVVVASSSSVVVVPSIVVGAASTITGPGCPAGPGGPGGPIGPRRPESVVGGILLGKIGREELGVVGGSGSVEIGGKTVVDVTGTSATFAVAITAPMPARIEMMRRTALAFIGSDPLADWGHQCYARGESE